MRAGIVVCCLAAMAGTAAADNKPPPRDGAGWKVYEDAFDALEVGDEARARDLLRVLITTHPDAPAGVKAKELLAQMDAAPGAVIGEATATTTSTTTTKARATTEHPTSGARAELAIVQMINGIYVGADLCFMAECSDAGPVIGLALLGGGVGLALSLGLTKHGLTPGTRAVYNSGTLWGLANAGGLLWLADPDSASAIGGGLLLGQAGGLLASAMVERLHPTAGQVALANTGGTWAAALSAALYVAATGDNTSDGFVTTVLVAGDLGLVIGGALANHFREISRARTLVIDAGGIVGGLTGAGAAILVSGDRDEKSTAGVAAIGAAIGLCTAAYFSRHWDDPHDAPPVRAALAPTRGGAMATVGVDF